MRVLVIASDDYACGHYRMIWPAEELARQGMDVKILRNGMPNDVLGMRFNGRVDVVNPPDCDVAVIQRPARRGTADLVEPLRRRGVAVVVDVDDDLAKIHPSNPAFRGMHPKLSPEYNWGHVARACRAASLVTVSVPSLLPIYAPHGRGAVLPNYVPTSKTMFRHDIDNPSPGWAGSLHSHPDDLDEAAGALQRLWRDGWPLKFVGPSEGVARKLGVDLPEDVFTGDLPFGSWIPAVAERIGVGVAPLADTAFNLSKSWLKPLEYSAAGVPWVASDTPEYRRLAKMCGAPLVRRRTDWYKQISRLVNDRGLRAELSGRARDTARELTIERHAHLWAEAWGRALRADRRTAAV